MTVFVWGETIICKCVKVYDGDTIEVRYGDSFFDIRLDGIDCPEESQEFHNESKQFTSLLVLGKEILVEILDQDQYGRYISKVTAGYKDLAYELVRSGLAWHYKRYSQDERLASAENQAKMEKKGIWSLQEPVPPWLFRQRIFNQMMAPFPYAKEEPSVVYITRYGECYHLGNCNSIKGEKRPITIEEAIKQGYRPCRICNPPER